MSFGDVVLASLKFFPMLLGTVFPILCRTVLTVESHRSPPNLDHDGGLLFSSLAFKLVAKFCCNARLTVINSLAVLGHSCSISGRLIVFDGCGGFLPTGCR